MITLKTLPNVTEQQVFDQVASHLLRQAEKSWNGRGVCYYRFNELQCAAGCLIGADEYNSTFEGKRWKALAALQVVPDTHLLLICRLQAIHDSYEPQEWRDELLKFAKANDLSDAVLYRRS